MLSETALLGAGWLGDSLCWKIRSAISRNPPVAASLASTPCSNRESAKPWARQSCQIAFADDRWLAALVRNLDEPTDSILRPGLPDEESIATSRVPTIPHFFEPVDYYGLMLLPLIKGWEDYGEETSLRISVGLCRHLERSAWRDRRAFIRFHRQRLIGRCGCGPFNSLAFAGFTAMPVRGWTAARPFRRFPRSLASSGGMMWSGRRTKPRPWPKSPTSAACLRPPAEVRNSEPFAVSRCRGVGHNAGGVVAGSIPDSNAWQGSLLDTRDKVVGQELV